jgi:AcrR family transcriptional regulator
LVVLTSETDIAAPAADLLAGNGAERTRQIVNAAYDLLDEEGLEGLTIRAVLKRTGLSRRAFYERFVGKDDLVLAVFEQTIRMAVQMIGDQVRPIADPMERLRLIVMAIVLGKGVLPVENGANDRRGAALSREHLRLAESRPAELQSAIRPLVMLIAEHLADGMKTGAVRTYDPQRLAALVYNLVSSTTHMELLTEEIEPSAPKHRDALAAEIWEFCQRAIAALS